MVVVVVLGDDPPVFLFSSFSLSRSIDKETKWVVCDPQC